MTPSQAEAIRKLVEETNARRGAMVEGTDRVSRIADHGSGKGYQWLARRVHETWGGILPHCYDPGVRQLSADLEPETFDGVICTNVMEHVERRFVIGTIRKIFGLLRPDVPTFAYFYICTTLAGKTFPDGRNLHLTVQGADWWNERLREYCGENVVLVAEYGRAGKD